MFGEIDMKQEYSKRMTERQKKDLLYQDIWNLLYFSGYDLVETKGESMESFLVRKREISKVIQQLNEDWEFVKRRI